MPHLLTEISRSAHAAAPEKSVSSEIGLRLVSFSTGAQ